jgi:hypothetical protein
MSRILNPEIADLFNLYGEEYQRRFGDSMPFSHKKAIRKIRRCRTPALGGEVYACPGCDRFAYSYHSCNSRHCPKCGGDKIQAWIKKQFDRLLPVPYFFVTFTVPSELRRLFRSHQRFFYDLFFTTSAAALKDLAQDRRFVGGKIGFLGVIQTWRGDLCSHIHIHYIVPGVALSFDHKRFLKIKNKRFLVHVTPLGLRFKYLFQKALRKTPFYAMVPGSVWAKDWVVHCEPAGYGTEIIKYVAPYVYRMAISNSRIMKLEDRKVSFEYRDHETKMMVSCTLEVIEFLRRFLQHVLPHGFIKVRYFGIMAANCNDTWLLLKYLLVQSLSKEGKKWFLNIPFQIQKCVRRCPKCGAVLILIGRLPRGP